jgi:hypothetical protein
MGREVALLEENGEKTGPELCGDATPLLRGEVLRGSDQRERETETERDRETERERQTERQSRTSKVSQKS